MQLPRSNSNSTTPSDTSSRAPPSVTAGATPSSIAAPNAAPSSTTAVGAAFLSTAATSAPPLVASGAAISSTTVVVPSGDNTDPFLSDNAMNTDEDEEVDVYSHNYSSVHPPHPIELIQPSNSIATFFVVTIGQVVGIIMDIDVHFHLRGQIQFAMTTFHSWYAAVGFYTVHFYSGNVRVVSANVEPPHRTLILRRVTPADSSRAAPPSGPPVVGSAANPIYVGTPTPIPVAAGPASSVQSAGSPTPVGRGTRWKGKGKATPVKDRPRPQTRSLATTRIRRNKPSVPRRVYYVSDSDSDADSSAQAPSNQACSSSAGVSAAVTSNQPNPSSSTRAAIGHRVVYVSDTDSDPDVSAAINASSNVAIGAAIEATIDVSDMEVDGADNMRPVVYGSDEEGPDFLPNYPRGLVSGSGMEGAALGTPSTARPVSRDALDASPASTEIANTVPTTPMTSRRPFLPLFSDGSDSGPRLTLAHMLRSGKMYRLTPCGRNLAQDGSEPLSPLTPLPLSSNGSPIAGPSRHSHGRSLAQDGSDLLSPFTPHSASSTNAPAVASPSHHTSSDAINTSNEAVSISASTDTVNIPSASVSSASVSNASVSSASAPASTVNVPAPTSSGNAHTGSLNNVDDNRSLLSIGDDYNISEIDPADLEAIGEAMDMAWDEWHGLSSK